MSIINNFLNRSCREAQLKQNVFISNTYARERKRELFRNTVTDKL